MGIHRLRRLAPLRDDEAAATARQFREQGFVRLDQLVGGRLLVDLQVAFRREQAPAGEAWAAAKRAREGGAEPSAPGQWHAKGYYDIPRVLESDPAYLELLATPRLVALLREVVGPQATLIHAQARTVPPEEEGGGYSGLHRDLARPIAASDVEAGGLPDHPTMSEHVKLFVALNEHTESNCTAVVPNTHHSHDGPSDTRPEAHPELERFMAQPGDAMLMDLRTWHTAVPNRSGRNREGLILMFGDWHRKAAAPVVTAARNLQQTGALKGADPILHQLLGIAPTPPPKPKPKPSTRGPPALQLEDWRPPRSPTAEEYQAAAEGLPGQLDFFRAHGFLHIPAAMEGEELRALQAAWERHEQEPERAWIEGQKSGVGVSRVDPLSFSAGGNGAYRKFFQMDWSDKFVEEPSFLHVLSHQAWLPLVEKVVGADCQVTHVQPRTVPAADGEGGYVTWQ